MGVLREQIDVSSRSHDELQSARDEGKALKRALEAATAERERDVASIQTNLSAASKDLDKWRQTANKYEREIEELQRDLQQQSKQWQKTAEIQGTTCYKHTYKYDSGCFALILLRFIIGLFYILKCAQAYLCTQKMLRIS